MEKSQLNFEKIHLQNEKSSKDLQDKIIQMFSQIKKGLTSQINFQEISQQLDQKSEKVFDRLLLNQIYQVADTNNRGFTSVEKFALEYADAEVKLKDKIYQIEEILKGHVQKKEATEKKLLDCLGKEVRNEYNIMKESKLTVTVKQLGNVQGLQSYSQAKIYCVLQCEKQRSETDPVQCNPNSQWDESFSFQISQGIENLKVIVLYQNVQEDAIIGQAEVPLGNLRDQQQHDSFYDLYKNNRKCGQIQLILQ